MKKDNSTYRYLTCTSCHRHWAINAKVCHRCGCRVFYPDDRRDEAYRGGDAPEGSGPLRIVPWSSRGRYEQAEGPAGPGPPSVSIQRRVRIETPPILGVGYYSIKPYLIVFDIPVVSMKGKEACSHSDRYVFHCRLPWTHLRTFLDEVKGDLTNGIANYHRT